MRKTKKSKILSLILCMSLIISTFAFMPQVAAADDSAAPTDATQQAVDSAEPGDNAADTQTDSSVDDEQVTDSDADSGETAEADSESIINAVNYTNVAPLAKNNAKNTTSKAKKAKKTSASKQSTTPQDPTKVEGEAPDGLVMNKTAKANDDGSYTIKLEAYSTGSVTSVDTSKPTDIVLVLDQSGSMSYKFNDVRYDKVYSNTISQGNKYYVYESNSYKEVSWCSDCKAWTDGCTHWIFYDNPGTKYTPKSSENDTSNTQFYTKTTVSSNQTRLDALKDAVTGFVTNVESQAEKDEVDHRIGIVGFSSDGYNNTELLTGVNIAKTDVKDLKRYNNIYYYPHEGDKSGEGRDGMQYYYITDKNYQNALQDVSTASGKTSVSNAIDALTAHGGTQTLDGLTMAEKIFANDSKKNDNRNKVVVLFTDGETDSNKNNTIIKAKALKDAGVTVYTVGIFDGADGTPNSDNNYTDANKLMHYVSSNYPDAESMNNGGNLNSNLKDGESYYLSAADSDTLKNIFEKISSQIGSTTINLGSQSVIRDIVSESFDMPENVSDIDVKTYDCLSYDESTKQAEWSANGTAIYNTVAIDKEKKKIDVTGFDFSKNYIAANGRDENDASKTGDFHGRKIVITFNIKPREGFWGGNNVPTNGENSGIYEDANATTPTGTFDVPTVNVPLNVPKATGNKKNIYLLGDTPSVDELYNFTIPTGDDAWKTAYVNVDVDYDKDKTVSNKEDTTLDVTITVSPKYTGKGADGKAVEDSVRNVTGKANVFKPELTYKDSTVYYGDTAPTSYNDNKVGGTVWKHGNKASTDDGVTMTGSEPGLNISYSPAIGSEPYYKGGKISTKQDIPVKATVKIGNDDVTNQVTFKHTDCDPECGFDNAKEQFLIHVKTCSLTVTKTGGVKDEPYVMNIYKDGKLYTSMTIVGNSSEMVYELPVGNYTVQEDTDWAWRYKEKAPTISGSVGLSKDNTSETIDVTNHDRFGSFLNGYSTVVKNIFDEKKSN